MFKNFLEVCLIAVGCILFLAVVAFIGGILGVICQKSFYLGAQILGL